MKKISHLDSDQKQKYGIMMQLIQVMGGESKVLESRDLINKLHAMIDKDLQSCFKRILDEPTDVPQWQDQIALLIGEAKTYQKYKELFTIKEK